MKGTYTFENVGGNKLTVSDSQASPVKNKLEIKVLYDQDEEPMISQIEFSFPAGTESTDFAEFQNLRQIEFRADGWTVPEVSRQQFRELKKNKREKGAGNKRWYACRYEKSKELVYALMPAETWTMKDHLILDLCMENVVTTAAEGTSLIQCSVEDLFGDIKVCQLEILKEKDHTVKIQDFYPESGSAAAGEQVRLNWFVENAQKLFLHSGGETQEMDPSKSSVIVPVSKTAEYTLEAVNGEKSDRRMTMVQVLPLYLKQFYIDYEERTVNWDVCCGKNIKIDGVPTRFSSGSADLNNYHAGSAIALSADGKNTSLQSLVYYAAKQESTDVVHFQKTITFYKDFQILDVSWELYGLESVNGAESIRIVYQDRERNELYDIKEGRDPGTKGSWQQILTGTDPSGAGENILMTMYIRLYHDGTEQGYQITI